MSFFSKIKSLWTQKKLRHQREGLYVVQTQKRASIGNLMSGLAHELNNPLTSIYSNLDPIKEVLQELKSSSDPKASPLFEKLDRMINRVEEGASRAQTILKDFRQYPGPKRQEKEEIDLGEVVDRSLELLTSKWEGRVRIEKNYEIIPKIKGYRGELGQVFTNLLSNAFDAISDEGVVRISLQRAAGGIKITISDTGKGIPISELGKIFDPFFTTKEPGEGTGLGLPIALQLVMNHKGSIEVKSKEGQGTEFLVFLPYE